MTHANQDSLEKEAKMLPRDPPPLIVRLIGWLLVAVFSAALACAVLIPFPETIRCRFELFPESGADPVQAPYAAVIDQVCVDEMAEVKAGDALYVLRSDEFRRRDTELQVATGELQSRRNAVAKFEEAHQTELAVFDHQVEQIEGEITFLQKYIKTSRKLRDTLSKLVAEGSVAELELDSRELVLTESEKDLHVAGQSLEQTRLRRHKAVVDRSRHLDEETTGIARLEYRIASLHEDLKYAEGNLLTVRAPYDAVVISLARHNTGGVVAPGDLLCQLTPRGTEIEVHLLVDGEGASRLLPGQTVRLFFDAFPYQRHGVVPGRVAWISPATVTGPEGSHFPAVATLDRTEIEAHGRSNRLRVGMTGEARTIVGHRTLVEYAFEPIRRLREDLRPE